MHRTETESTFQRPAHAAAKTCRRTGRGLAVLLLCGLAMSALAAAAQTTPRAPGRAVIDKNGDGVLDEQELRSARVAAFATADADRDGYLTADELDSARMAGDFERRTRGLGTLLRTRGRNADSAAERFERLDVDGDGRVAEREFVEAPHPLLRLDADGDGRVTREEIEQGRKALRPGLL